MSRNWITRLLGIMIVLQVAVSPGNLEAAYSPQKTKLPSHISSLLDSAQRLFYRNDHDGALNYLQKYFSKLLTMPKAQARAALRFHAIAAMGRIYLQYKKDPEAAIRWFEKQQKTQPLSDAENDIISGWIAAARDWQKTGKFPTASSTEQELFSLGQKYYQSGIKKQSYPMDQKGAADFSIASSYLVPFLVHFDKSANAGEALFMMGDIRRRQWGGENEYWSENYYLTETIRRFPGTPLAMRAYEALDEDVRFGYSGSSGESTPASWLELLGTFKKMAQGNASPEKKLEPEDKSLQ